MLVVALSTGERYVAGAYLVFLALVLSYLAIMAIKLSRLEREIVALSELVERADAAPPESVAAAAPKEEPVA